MSAQAPQSGIATNLAARPAARKAPSTEGAMPSELRYTTWYRPQATEVRQLRKWIVLIQMSSGCIVFVLQYARRCLQVMRGYSRCVCLITLALALIVASMTLALQLVRKCSVFLKLEQAFGQCFFHLKPVHPKPVHPKPVQNRASAWSAATRTSIQLGLCVLMSHPRSFSGGDSTGRRPCRILSAALMRACPCRGISAAARAPRRRRP